MTRTPTTTPLPDYVPARYARRISVTEYGCWSWHGALTTTGYGKVGWQGRTWTLHRLMWQLAGNDPAPLLDHRCHDPLACAGGDNCPHRRCVNPAHLMPATPKQNAAPERSARGGMAWTGDRCRAGHDVTGTDAVYVDPQGTRSCRECNRRHERDRQDRNRQVYGVARPDNRGRVRRAR